MEDIGVWELLLGVVTIVAILFAVTGYVRYLVNKMLDSPETIDKLSKLIRPAVIFDNEGRVLADLGAMEYIESIVVTSGIERLPIRIELKCKTFLALPPLLTSLDIYAYEETVSRNGKFGWIFNLKPISYETSETTSYRFRFEVLR